jgi:hypothetical protein
VAVVVAAMVSVAPMPVITMCGLTVVVNALVVAVTVGVVGVQFS